MTNLSDIRQGAAKDRRLQFTAWFHHITPYLLKDSFFQLKRKSAAGVDGVTWQAYQRDLDNRLASLHERLTEAKPFTMSKRLVWQAWQKVKANKGVAGVDDQSIADFEVNLSGNLYNS